MFFFYSNVDDDECLFDTLGDTDSNVKSIFKNFLKNNMDKIISAHLIINSINNKFDQLSDMIKGHIAVLMILEYKPGRSYPDGRFLGEGYGAPFRLNQNKLGGDIMLFVRSNIPTKLLLDDIGFERFFS